MVELKKKKKNDIYSTITHYSENMLRAILYESLLILLRFKYLLI